MSHGYINLFFLSTCRTLKVVFLSRWWGWPIEKSFGKMVILRQYLVKKPTKIQILGRYPSLLLLLALLSVQRFISSTKTLYPQHILKVHSCNARCHKIIIGDPMPPYKSLIALILASSTCLSHADLSCPHCGLTLYKVAIANGHALNVLASTITSKLSGWLLSYPVTEHIIIHISYTPQLRSIYASLPKSL